MILLRARFAAVLVLLAGSNTSLPAQSVPQIPQIPQIPPVLSDHDQHSVLRAQEADSHHGMHMSQDSAIAAPERAGKSFIEPPPIPGESAFAWSGTVSSESGQSPGYMLDSLLSLAASHNPTLRESRLHINAELARAMQAGLYPNPTASYVAEQIGLSGTAGEWQGAEIEQRFVTAGKLDLSRSKYLHRAKVAEHLAVAQQFRVCNDVRIHFYQALAAGRIADLHRELLKTAEDNLLTTREMYNLGQVNRAGVHNANAMLQKHRLNVMKAENNVRRNFIELMSLVGVDADAVPLEGTLASDRELIDFETAWSRILDCSPELLAAGAKLREDSTTVQRERVEWVPDVVVGGGAGYNNVDKQTTASARVMIEIPLFDRNQGTIQQAQLDFRRQQNEIQRLQLSLRRQLAMEYDQYVTAWQHIVEYDSVILPARKNAYELALHSYKANRAEWPDVLSAQEAYTTARAEYVTQQKIRRTSEVLMDGYLLHGGLKTPQGPVPGGHIDSVPKPR